MTLKKNDIFFLLKHYHHISHKFGKKREHYKHQFNSLEDYNGSGQWDPLSSITFHIKLETLRMSILT